MPGPQFALSEHLLQPAVAASDRSSHVSKVFVRSALLVGMVLLGTMVGTALFAGPMRVKELGVPTNAVAVPYVKPVTGQQFSKPKFLLPVQERMFVRSAAASQWNKHVTVDGAIKGDEDVLPELKLPMGTGASHWNKQISWGDEASKPKALPKPEAGDVGIVNTAGNFPTPPQFMVKGKKNPRYVDASNIHAAFADDDSDRAPMAASQWNGKLSSKDMADMASEDVNHWSKQISP